MSSACNFDPAATLNDGSCDFTSCLGCTDAAACNYDADATANDGSCAYPEPEYDCEGNCLVDSDGDGVCDAFDGNFDGCMDPLACNYEPLADTDNGSCDYCSCIGYTTDMPEYGVEIDEYAVNGIPGYTTYRVYITTPNATDKVSAVTGQAENPLYIETTGDFYQHPYGGVFPNGINPILYDFFPKSSTTAGLPSALTQFLSPASVRAASRAARTRSVERTVRERFRVHHRRHHRFRLVRQSRRDQRRRRRRSPCLLAQLTTNGDLTGQVYVQVFPEGDNLMQERVTLTFGGSQCGCTDEAACNYRRAR